MKSFDKIFYFRERKECDFVVLEGSTVKWLIQVCDTLHANNRDREVNGMIEAMEFFNLKTGHILSLNQSDNLKIDGREIIVHPAREFFL